MRAEIQRYGHSIVGCDQLLVFVSATDPIHAQFGHIFTMAEQQGWSVEFRPDGTVPDGNQQFFGTAHLALTRRF